MFTEPQAWKAGARPGQPMLAASSSSSAGPLGVRQSSQTGSGWQKMFTIGTSYHHDSTHGHSADGRGLQVHDSAMILCRPPEQRADPDHSDSLRDSGVSRWQVRVGSALRRPMSGRRCQWPKTGGIRNLNASLRHGSTTMRAWNADAPMCFLIMFFALEWQASEELKLDSVRLPMGALKDLQIRQSMT